MPDKVPRRSLEGLLLQVYPLRSAGSDILLNMTDAPGLEIKFILKYMNSSLSLPLTNWDPPSYKG